MKNIKLPSSLSYGFNDIIDYVNNTWSDEETIKNNINLFDSLLPIWEKSLEMAKYNFDQIYCYQLLKYWKREQSKYSNWKEAGTLLLEEEFNEQIQNNSVIKFINKIEYSLIALEYTIKNNIDMNGLIQSLTEQLMNNYPSIKDYYPKENADPETLECIKKNEDKGINHIETLVQSIVLQAFNFKINDNSLAILNELKKIHSFYDNSKYRVTINSDIDLTIDIAEPITQCLLGIVKNSEEYLMPYHNNSNKDLVIDISKNQFERLREIINNVTPEENHEREQRKEKLKLYISRQLN